MATAKDLIAQAKARASQTKTFPVAAWGIDVTIRRLTLLEVQTLSAEVGGDQVALSKALFVASLTEPTFTREEADELWAVDTPDGVLEVVKEINAFNNLGGQQVNGKELSNVEAAAYSFPVGGAEQAG